MFVIKKCVRRGTSVTTITRQHERFRTAPKERKERNKIQKRPRPPKTIGKTKKATTNGQTYPDTLSSTNRKYNKPKLNNKSDTNICDNQKNVKGNVRDNVSNKNVEKQQNVHGGTSTIIINGQYELIRTAPKERNTNIQPTQQTNKHHTMTNKNVWREKCQDNWHKHMLTTTIIFWNHIASQRRIHEKKAGCTRVASREAQVIARKNRLANVAATLITQNYYSKRARLPS